MKPFLARTLVTLWVFSPMAVHAATVAELIQNAMMAANQRNWPQAAQFYEQALRSEPRNAALYNNLAVIKRRQGNIPAAITAYRQALSLDPNLTEAYGNLGIALLLNREWAEAFKVLTVAQSRGGRDPALPFYLGLAQERLERWPEAQALYQQFVQTNPQPFAFYRLAIAAWQNGNGTVALDAFRNAARLDTGLLLYQSEAGLALAKVGQSQEAIDFLQTLPARWSNPTDLVVLARLAYQVQRWDLAETAIQQALQLGRPADQSLSVISDAAVIAIRSQPDRDPLALLTTAVATIPNAVTTNRRDYALVLANLAALYLEQKDYRLAASTGEQALRWDENFAPAYNTTAVAYLGLNQPQKARELLQMAITKDETAWQPYRNLGITYAWLGDREAASDAWRTAFTKAPSVEIQRSLNDELVRLQAIQLPTPVLTPSPTPSP